MEKTPKEYREQAARHEQDAVDSFERSDTDGFVSQWASGVCAREDRLKAAVAENGGRWRFPALFTLDGELVAAKAVETRFGFAFGILESDDPRSRFVSWFNPSEARSSDRQWTNDGKKGYRVGYVLAPARVELKGSGTGLAGALSVSAVAVRTDGGFSRDVDVAENPRDGKTYWYTCMES